MGCGRRWCLITLAHHHPAYKPQNLFAYGSPTLADMAASYAAGIILNLETWDTTQPTLVSVLNEFSIAAALGFIWDKTVAIIGTTPPGVASGAHVSDAPKGSFQNSPSRVVCGPTYA